MTDEFWTGGPEAYAEGLRERYEPQLDELRKRRDEAGESIERDELEAEIQRVESEYKSKLDSIDDALF